MCDSNNKKKNSTCSNINILLFIMLKLLTGKVQERQIRFRFKLQKFQRVYQS